MIVLLSQGNIRRVSVIKIAHSSDSSSRYYEGINSSMKLRNKYIDMYASIALGIRDINTGKPLMDSSKLATSPMISAT